MAIQEVAPGIFASDHRVADGKNGIIFGARGALAVDVGTYPEEGQIMADFIRQQNYAPDRVILTHGHGDHILGGAAFAGGEVYAHEKTPEVCRRFLRKLAERKGDSYDQLMAGVLWPTVMFNDELYIDLGGKHIRVFGTPGHSEDGVSIYIEEDRALIAGDSVVTSIVPALHDGNSRVLEASLRKLQMIEIEIMIPGHGAVVHGPTQVQDWLAWLIGYLAGVRHAVHEIIDAGSGSLDPEQIAANIDFDHFIGDRLPREQHGMEKRHRDTVLNIIEEELKSTGKN
jgi:glyoxylase-like metal-dependent hydrolase (beta-lactamase superfamily II)